MRAAANLHQLWRSRKGRRQLAGPARQLHGHCGRRPGVPTSGCARYWRESRLSDCHDAAGQHGLARWRTRVASARRRTRGSIEYEILHRVGEQTHELRAARIPAGEELKSQLGGGGKISNPNFFAIFITRGMSCCCCGLSGQVRKSLLNWFGDTTVVSVPNRTRFQRMRKYPFLVSPAMAAGLAFTLLLPCAPAQATTTIYFTANDVIETFTPPGPMTNFSNLPVFTNPEGLAFDTSGNLFVAGGGDVSKITPGGTVSLFSTLPRFGGYGMGVCAGPPLFVAGAASVEIKKITPGGVVSTYATLSEGHTGLAIDSIGNLYTVGGGNTIKKIPVGGGAVSIYATLPGNNNYGLAFDSARSE